ncbi:MAG: DEAD/DEAH box helicase [Methanomicrobiales archaeon]
MKVVVQPQKGTYKLIYLDGKRVTATGTVELEESSKGWRPSRLRLRTPRSPKRHPHPTRELISRLRESKVYLTAKDRAFVAFLRDLQIPYHYIRVCRLCLLEDRVTTLRAENIVRYGRETICLDCARRELRREAGFAGGLGRLSFEHLESLLEEVRDFDRVLSLLQPASGKQDATLYDRLEAHEIQKTSRIDDLPLPKAFRTLCGVETLMPVQELAVRDGLLQGEDLLVVAATASGKTFVGEMAGLKNHLEGRGRMLFLVPLVALANQKYQRFRDQYGSLGTVSLHTGVSRLNLPETRAGGERDIRAPVVVGTYEGIDHHLRCGKPLGEIGTVVIDEVQMLDDPERGHRLDGLIARLRYIAPDAQFLFLSATIGLPDILAGKLSARLVRYEARPVPLERHLLFTDRKEKIRHIKQMVAEEFRHTSSKGYRGQSIVFTHSRVRCHIIADAIGKKAAPYHAGLSAAERREVERKFQNGELAAVVTTAALAAGVDFPASQVIFDALVMGIEWLSVQEFTQMMGRAGRPEYHDLGKVVVLAEPGGTYSRDATQTEEEVAIRLMKGVMEEVSPEYGLEESSEELVANAVVCGGDEEDLAEMTNSMVGAVEPTLHTLMEHRLVRRRNGRVELTPLSRVMAEHFIGMERLLRLRDLVHKETDPLVILAELECADLE